MQVTKGQQVPVEVVGSSTFGRYPKISLSKTYNMFISDEWLVNYAGYRKRFDLVPGGQGRAIFNSIRGNFILIVISSAVIKLDAAFNQIFVGQINTTQGSVSIDENLADQICIVDGQDAYIYNYVDNTLTIQTLIFNGAPIFPSYVCYHNSFFLIGSDPRSLNSQNWYAFEFDTDSTIKLNTDFPLQTKPDFALLVKRLPGRGNNVLVLGSAVGEVWTQVGGLENYRRVQSFNIDNGILSTSTLAANDEYVCWLSQNENNSPCIMITDGSNAKRISSDGIDFVLSELRFPGQSTAFFYRQDGHLFYHITFYNPVDNLTLIYDFTTQKFFHGSDENQNYYPARQAIFFNGVIFFVSINDGGLYEMDTGLLTYNYTTDPNVVGEEIPRIRICNTIRKPDADRFRVGKFTFILEQGVISVNPPAPSRIDMSISKNGNQSFGNIVSRSLNNTAQFRNQIIWERMGQANEFTVQLRFIGFQRFVLTGGTAEVY